MFLQLVMVKQMNAPGSTRPGSALRWLAILGMLACGGTAAAERLSQELAPADARAIADPACCEPMWADARLSDVCFVDRDHGWAVGDRGTIWHTDDAGRNWGLQRSDVRCRLHSVCFLNLSTGWAAGGCSLPYSGNSSGVVLFTHDGGQHWVRDPKLLLPALRQVRFSSSNSRCFGQFQASGTVW
jgi:hypothetical protein